MTTIAPPPPAPVTPPPLTPGRRNAIRVLLILIASALVLGCVVALGISAWRINSLRLRVESEDLPATMRSLVIDAVDARVHVQVDPRASAPSVELRVVDSARDGQRRLQVTSGADGTRILLAPNQSSLVDWGRTEDVTVTLSPQVARGLSVTTEQDDGTVVVDADLDRLTAHTVDGDVVLNGGARRVDVTASDGDIVVRKPISVAESFSARTVDGDVDVAFSGAAPRTVDASSRDGDISIGLPGAGPFLVDAPGDSRRIRVPETSDPARAAARVTVRTVDGDVEIGSAGAVRPGRR